MQKASMTLGLVAAALALAGCGEADSAGRQKAGVEGASNRVETSGKEAVPLEQVPAEVIAAARAARPGFTPAEAERETREGRLYYDVEGRTAEGQEIEFDIMQEGAGWRVVETQRDIPFAEAPAPVREAAAAHAPGITPTRVIESVQADGLVIYEVYAAEGGDPQGRKVEVRWDGSEASILTQEWQH